MCVRPRPLPPRVYISSHSPSPRTYKRVFVVSLMGFASDLVLQLTEQYSASKYCHSIKSSYCQVAMPACVCLSVCPSVCTTSFVKLGDHSSTAMQCASGVPQGSVLRPLLFTAYVSPVMQRAHRVLWRLISSVWSSRRVSARTTALHSIRVAGRRAHRVSWRLISSVY